MQKYFAEVFNKIGVLHDLVSNTGSWDKMVFDSLFEVQMIFLIQLIVSWVLTVQSNTHFKQLNMKYGSQGERDSSRIQDRKVLKTQLIPAVMMQVVWVILLFVIC